MQREFLIIAEQPQSAWVRAFEEALGEFGTVRVASAEEARQGVDESSPEVIVVDGGNEQSRDLVRRLRKQHPGARFVLAVAAPSWKQIRKASRAVQAEVIDKSLDRTQLVRTLVEPTVLLADNKKNFLEARKRFLHKEGFNVVTAETYDEAKAKLLQGDFDLAILDIRLKRDRNPKDDSGLTLAEMVPAGLPKLFLTNFPSPDYARRALRRRRGRPPLAEDFLDKREPLNEFKRRVWQAIRENPHRSAPLAEAAHGEARESRDTVPPTTETSFERLFEAKFERLLESKLAKLQEKNLEGLMDRLVRGPVLDNYEGYVCARFEEPEEIRGHAGGSERRKPRSGAGSLHIWLQPRPPRDSTKVAADAIDISNGRDAEAVTFDLEVDSEEVRFHRDRASLQVQPGKRSKHLVFRCKPISREGSYQVWVRVFQKNRLLQVLPTDVAPAIKEAVSTSRAVRNREDSSVKASG